MREGWGKKNSHRLALIAALVTLSLPAPLVAQTELIGRTEVEELKWGGVEYGWHHLFHQENVRFDPGPRGQLSVVLDDDVALREENTELLLPFDLGTNQIDSESAERYDLEKVEVFHSNDVKRHGAGAAGFLRYGNRVEIRPRASSLFFRHDPLQSFSIDFYLYPTTVHDSIVVLSWYAATVDDYPGPTGVRAFFKDGRLHWEFGNVFHRTDGEATEPGAHAGELPDGSAIVIGELHPTPLNEWHHHGMHYDALKGLITLTFDGRESNLIWTTNNRSEQGNQLRGRISPYLGVPMVLGEHMLGYIDEFRISSGVPEGLERRDRGWSDVKDQYRGEGTISSDVIDLKNRGTKVLRLAWDSVEEQGTAVRVYCRVSNRYFTPDMEPEKGPREMDEDVRPWPPDPETVQLEGRNMAEVFQRLKRETAPPPWQPVRNGEEIGGGVEIPKGRYVQWKVKLYGTEGNYTPRLNTLALVYEPDPPPTAPILLAAKPVNRGISLTWVKNKEKDVVSYRIYYGEASRFYMDNEPESVAQSAGETLTYELDNLRNDRVYFVSITAVDDDGQESGFSKELVARPSAVYQ